MEHKLGNDADEVLKELTKAGVNRNMAKEALQIAEQKAAFTIFAMVDALTRRLWIVETNAGDRMEADRQAAGLLAFTQ